MDKLQLGDLVEKEILQEFQDVLEKKTLCSAIIMDAQGNDMTTFQYEVPFCTSMTKGSKKGCAMCNQCNSTGAMEAEEKGTVVQYRCHAGLIDIVAPIKAKGQLYGYVMGGQVTTEPLQKEKVEALAYEYGIDPAKYWEAAQKVPVVELEKLQENAFFINSIARIISHIAESKYDVLEASKEVEAAAKMKTDFLANMSHEIRTPMNAVIGMADMALREDLPEEAREYVGQIKRSGKTLLAIINDILDFSKIESGKMDITMGSYSPMEVFDDVAGIISTRLAGKNVELIMDVDSNIPKELMGDSVRIKQVIINLAGNGAKFTHEGYLAIRANFARRDEKWQDMTISIEDTGIGIKKEDLERIFDSFQQVDSKRNRNIEGTGLGLAISKQLVDLMKGSLEVESEYGVGSKFYFTIPQLEFEPTKAIELPQNVEFSVALRISNCYVREQMIKDISRVGGNYVEISEDELANGDIPEGVGYVFSDNLGYAEAFEFLAATRPEVTFALLIESTDHYRSQVDNFVVIHKPFYINQIAKLIKKEQLHQGAKDLEVIDFVAPDAKVLVVDDNEVNLSVVTGLLKPIKMQVETAQSGKRAIEMIEEKHYDLIFMDHMMPEMDGVETTHIIRRFHEEYNDVPIIALTANVVEEAKRMMLVEGMDDFLGKPIELDALIHVVHRWLPEDLVQKVEPIAMKTSEEGKLQIEGLKLDDARELVGSEEVLLAVLGNYYKIFNRKYDKILNAWESQEWKDYTIEVHALKSASRQIGAIRLADMAAALEAAGNAKDVDTIMRDTQAMLDEYRVVQAMLEPYFAEKDMEEAKEKPMISKEELVDCFAKLENAMEELDLDGMEEAVQRMDEYQMSGSNTELFVALKEAVNNIDIDECQRIIKSFILF